MDKMFTGKVLCWVFHVKINEYFCIVDYFLQMLHFSHEMLFSFLVWFEPQQRWPDIFANISDVWCLLSSVGMANRQNQYLLVVDAHRTFLQCSCTHVPRTFATTIFHCRVSLILLISLFILYKWVHKTGGIMIFFCSDNISVQLFNIFFSV